MIIPINEKYRITSDPYCWSVERFTGNRWRAIDCYHNDLSSMAEALLRRDLCSEVPEGLQLLIEAERSLDQIIDEICNHPKVVAEQQKIDERRRA